MRASHLCCGFGRAGPPASLSFNVRPRREYKDSIPLGGSSVGRRCWCLLPRRLFLSLAENRREHVEGMVADEHQQLENRASLCGGDPKIPALALCSSGYQVGHTGGGGGIPRFHISIFLSTMTRPNEAHSVDAPIALLFHIVHCGRRATDAQSWATAP